MAGNSSISWTDKTWNPIAGCSIVSPGCTNCYAMKMADRLKSMAPKPDGSGNHGLLHYTNVITRDPTGRGYDWSAPVWTGVINPAPEHILLAPLKWKKPARIFVNSMSDLFHESVPDALIDKVFAVMALCPQHTFQVLTKRSKRMREYLTCELFLKMQNLIDNWECEDDFPFQKRGAPWIKNHFDFSTHAPDRSWLGNVLLGVSCEDQTRADERIPDLLATPAAVRFVSAEPLLGAIDFRKWTPSCYECGESCGERLPGPPRVERCFECGEECDQNTEPVVSEGCPKCGGELEWVCPSCNGTMVYQHPNTPILDQIIVGGESGPGHRPLQIEWAEAIRQQCADAGTAFFFKQDSGPRAGMQGRASDALWACKQMVEVK